MSMRARWILVVSIFALAAGSLWAAYHRMNGQTIWRVAVSQHRADDAMLINELGSWMAKQSRRTRLQVVTVEDEAAAVGALRSGAADLASVRGDAPMPGGINSALALYREAAIFIATPRSGIDDWTKLKGRTIALVGHTEQQDMLIQKILHARNVTDVKFVTAGRNDLDDLLKRNSVQVVAQVSPMNNSQHADMKTGRNLRRIKGSATMLEITDAEALAAADNRYEGYDVPMGGLRDAPPLPSEETTTLAVIRHLVVRSGVQPLSVQRALIDVMDAKRAVSPDFPLARQIGSPGVEKDAAIKIHAGALGYFNGDEIRLWDMLIDWIYIVPMVIGFAGALITWLYNLLWPAKAHRTQDMVVELFMMRRKAAQALEFDDLQAIEKRLDELQEQIDGELAASAFEDDMAATLLLAADAVDRKLDQMRARLTAGRAAVGMG